MTMSESLHLLGLTAHATRSQIIEARRRLSLLHHPDRGGDSALMARINRAADELLTNLAVVDPTTIDNPKPTRVREPRRVLVDRPSFVVDVLPVVAHEVLTLAVLSIGEIVDDDPPYVIEFVVADGHDEHIWCRAEIVPDAGSSTVSLMSELSDPERLDTVRDLIVREINSIGLTD